jgi:hypothetical protein
MRARRSGRIINLSCGAPHLGGVITGLEPSGDLTPRDAPACAHRRASRGSAGAPHTVEDLIAIAGLHGEPTEGQPVPPVKVRAWLGPAGHARGPRLGRAVRLDAYTLQVLVDDARRAGPGARLDIVVTRDTPAVVTAAIQRRLAHLARRGVDVRVRPERRRRRHEHAP